MRCLWQVMTTYHMHAVLLSLSSLPRLSSSQELRSACLNNILIIFHSRLFGKVKKRHTASNSKSQLKVKCSNNFSKIGMTLFTKILKKIKRDFHPVHHWLLGMTSLCWGRSGTIPRVNPTWKWRTMSKISKHRLTLWQVQWTLSPYSGVKRLSSREAF